MSLDYTLSIATELTPAQVAALLVSLAGWREDEVDLWGRGVNARVLEESGLSREIIEEDFGFSPSVGVVFHVVPGQGYEEGFAAMMRAVALLLSRVTGDAVMLKSAELMVLQRRKGHVTLSAQWSGNLAPELNRTGIGYKLSGVLAGEAERREIRPEAA